jgi:hypothetical protein
MSACWLWCPSHVLRIAFVEIGETHEEHERCATFVEHNAYKLRSELDK